MSASASASSSRAPFDLGAAFLEQSRCFLRDDYLPKIKHSVAALDDRAVWWRPNDSSNSIGNLLLHLAGNIRQWIVSGVGGAPDVRDRQAEFDERSPIHADTLLTQLEEAVTDADAVLARLTPGDLPGMRTIQGNTVTVFGAIYHVVEHFSTHTGQIILLAKAQAGDRIRFYELVDGNPRPIWHDASRGAAR